MNLPAFQIDQKEAHKKLDSIYTELFSAIEKKRLTFIELSEGIFNRKNELTSLILKGALDYELYEIEKIRRPCPCCSHMITKHRQKTSILQSINGLIAFSRNYFYCRKCKIGFCPSDKDMEIIPRRLQFDVQWRALEIAVKFPFEEAEAELKKHYGVVVDKKILHKTVQAISDGLTIVDISRNPSEIRETLLTLKNGNHRRVVVVIGIDGAFVPIRPDHKSRSEKRGKGYWREAKGIRVYAISDKRIHHVLSWHQIQEANQLEECLERVLESNLIPNDIARICVCADGANWIWNRVRKVYPDAKLVLDYYHCSEHLHHFAEIYFSDESKKLKWLKDAKEDIFSGNVLNLVERLGNMKDPEENEISNEIASLANYLKERAEMTYYSSFKKGGYPIGSGGIEAANKHVCHHRMKLSGAWWKEEMANAMLALRSAHANGTLHKVFSRYRERQMKEYFPNAESYN